MACGLDLARLRSLSPGLLHELCSIVWFVYLTDQLSFQVKMSHPCHLCCLGLLCANSLCDAGVLCPLTGVSNPSPSSTNEHMSFLCLRSVLPQDQTTGHLTEQLSERSLSLECICVYLYIYQWGTDLWNTCITAQHCKRCFVLLLPYLIIMLLKSQALEQWLRCLPSLSPSPSISQINFFFLFFTPLTASAHLDEVQTVSTRCFWSLCWDIILNLWLIFSVFGDILVSQPQKTHLGLFLYLLLHVSVKSCTHLWTICNKTAFMAWVMEDNLDEDVTNLGVGLYPNTGQYVLAMCLSKQLFRLSGCQQFLPLHPYQEHSSFSC